MLEVLFGLHRSADDLTWINLAVRTVTVFATGIVLARWALTKKEFGAWGILQTTVGLFGLLAGFGLGMAASRYVALYRASDPAPAVAEEAVVSVPEGATIALTGQAEQIGEVTEAPDGSAPGEAAEAASKTDLKTDLAPTEFIEVWRPGRRDDHARKPRHEILETTSHR